MRWCANCLTVCCPMLARAAKLGLDYPGVHGAPGLGDTDPYEIQDHRKGFHLHGNHRYQPDIEAGLQAYSHPPQHHNHRPPSASEFTPDTSPLTYDPVRSQGGHVGQVEYATPDTVGRSTKDLEENRFKLQDRRGSGAFVSHGRDLNSGAPVPARGVPAMGRSPQRRRISPRAYRNQHGPIWLSRRDSVHFLVDDVDRLFAQHKARRQRKPRYAP